MTIGDHRRAQAGAGMPRYVNSHCLLLNLIVTPLKLRSQTARDARDRVLEFAPYKRTIKRKSRSIPCGESLAWMMETNSLDRLCLNRTY